MASTREIRRRIRSIRNTAQITRALQMTSASKMQKAQDQARAISFYADGLFEIVNMIGNVRNYKSPYIREVKGVKRAAIMIIGPGRGFVGPLVAELTLAIDRFIDEVRLKHESVEVVSITKHKVGKRISDSLKLNNVNHFEKLDEQPTSTDIGPMIEVVTKGFENGDFDEVYIAYTHFISTINQKVVVKKILPLSFETDEKENEQATVDYIFEPDRQAVLDELLPEYFEIQVYAALVDSIASEHSARMVAMKNATDNAKELARSLSLKYNRARQAKITSELIDIVAASN